MFNVLVNNLSAEAMRRRCDTHWLLNSVAHLAVVMLTHA